MLGVPGALLVPATAAFANPIERVATDQRTPVRQFSSTIFFSTSQFGDSSSRSSSVMKQEHAHFVDNTQLSP